MDEHVHYGQAKGLGQECQTPLGKYRVVSLEPRLSYIFDTPFLPL